MLLTHVDSKSQPTMVDVSTKTTTVRSANAESRIKLPESIHQLFRDGEYVGKKGPVIATAIVAGTMAAKNTSQLVPFCHSIALESCKINANFSDSNEIVIQCRVKCSNKTGVEMEALVGASVAALTIYDMLKALSHDIEITSTRLLQKTGGKSDYNADS